MALDKAIETMERKISVFPRTNATGEAIHAIADVMREMAKLNRPAPLVEPEPEQKVVKTTEIAPAVEEPAKQPAAKKTTKKTAKA